MGKLLPTFLVLLLATSGELSSALWGPPHVQAFPLLLSLLLALFGLKMGSVGGPLETLKVWFFVELIIFLFVRVQLENVRSNSNGTITQRLTFFL